MKTLDANDRTRRAITNSLHHTESGKVVIEWFEQRLASHMESLVLDGLDFKTVQGRCRELKEILDVIKKCTKF